MTDFILGVFEITIGMSLFIALLLIGLKLFGSKFTAKCRYIIWALVMIRLAIPFSFGLLPTLIEIPIDTELVQSQDLSSVLSENTDSVTSVQPSDPGDVVVTPTTPSTPVFPNVDTANPGSTPILPVTPTVPGDQAESVIPSDPVIETPTEQPVSLRQILDIAGIVYLTGAAIFLVWSLVSYFIYTRKILRSAKAADERTQKIFSTICKKYGMKKQPTLLVASGIHSPAAFGIFHRRIVLPDIAFTDNGLVGTLAHEVTHCKRGDLYMKLVELIACSLNWFNPLVHIAAFKCEMEMELSCDEKVLTGSSDAARAAYGEVMLDIIRRCRRNRGALTTHFNPKKSAVTARFKNILYGSGKRRGRILIGVCLVLCVLAGAFVACQTGDDLTDDHWYAEGYYLKCDNGSDVIVMDADGANPASPCQMTPADDSVSFEGLTDGDRIKVEISMIMTTYPGQTEVYSIEKLSDGERVDIDSAVLDSLHELGWIDDTTNQKELPKYLEIPVITLTQIETLPYSEETAVFTASPVGGNPTIFFFDDSRTFYFRKYLSTNMDAEFFTGTLTLPDGFTDAKLLHVTRGAGSGEIFVSIEAIYDGKKEYLTYGFFGTEAPSGVDVLDEVQVQRLMAAMKQISTTQITEYKFNIPLEDRLDYIVPASIYGEIHPYVIPDRYAPYIQTNEYSPDGVGYVTFGVANDMKPSNVFSRCYTYRITQKGGYIVSVEEVETISKETVLQNGTPYSGNSAGRFTGVAYDRTRTATVSGNEISVGSYRSHTDAGGTYVGTYTYDAKTGDFSAELAFQYMSNGIFITNDPETISGKLYEYGGFVHFVCTSSNISTVNVNDTLPMTFFPVASNEEYQMKKYTETLTGDNGKTYQISFDLPAEWTYGSGGIFEDANGNKRIGNRVIAVDISKEDFVSSLEEMAERYHVDLDSPIKGTSDSGIAYMGYCFEGEREIPGDITGRYLYRFTYSDSISMHMDVWKRNAYDDDSYYEQFVLPIIQSVTIRELSTETIFASILENKQTFCNASSKESVLLSEYKAETDYSVKKYTILDLNDDRDPEMVLWLGYGTNDYAGFLVLHRDGDTVYAHGFPYRGFNGLNGDGVYTSSSSAFNMSILKLDFDGAAYTETVLARREGDGSPESVMYYIEGRIGTEEEFNKYFDRYNSRSIPDWYSYDIEEITDIDDWHTLLWAEGLPDDENRQPSQNVYSFIRELVSGESDIPEINGLGIKDYSIALLKDSAYDSLFRFTFTVTGNFLPQTLLPGAYTWMLLDGMELSIYTEGIPATQEEAEAYWKQMRGLDRFEGNSAVEAVNTYLSWMPYIYEVSPYGKWDPENYHLPYNYICAHYGNENLEISFDKLQSLMSEKFGITVERPTDNRLLSRCEYNKDTDTVRYTDTRGYEAVHRILDIREEDGITYVIVQLFADRHRMIPSHKLQFAIGEGEVFLGSEIIQEGNYDPRELS